jgi:ribonucleoside-diphosphate reductase alpha chain
VNITSIRQVRRRSGDVVPFDSRRIHHALYRAFLARLHDEQESERRAADLTDKIIPLLGVRFGEIPTVEEIQDLVEEMLIQEGFSHVAKAYILYRRQHQDIREMKSWMGVQDELKLPVNTIRVLQRRYLRKDDQGRIIESPAQMFRRVARAVAKAERVYGLHGLPSAGAEGAATGAEGEGAAPASAGAAPASAGAAPGTEGAAPGADRAAPSMMKMDAQMNAERYAERYEDMFYSVMANREFMPNSPTLMNAGTPIGQLSACFVIPVEDSIRNIFEAVKNMALIHQSGGGTGFSFSRLRPVGDIVNSTKGIASGPVSFMEIFDIATGVVKQGGRRRGANMGILRVDHPDIVDFITAKGPGGPGPGPGPVMEGRFRNFNLSVAVTDDYMRALDEGRDYGLINPRTGQEVRRVQAREIFDLIAHMAWKTGDPGMIFIDTINRANPTPELGRIEATNPCGELPLLPYESCNLASINLSRMIKMVKEGDGEMGRRGEGGIGRWGDRAMERGEDGGRGRWGEGKMERRGDIPQSPRPSVPLSPSPLAFPSPCLKDEGQEKDVDWERLSRMVHLGVQFLDDIIEVNRFPLPAIEKITRANRKIGLGVMGFADLLLELGIPYNSDSAVHMAERIMKHIQEEAWKHSRQLARERGAFPNFPSSIYGRTGNAPVRNATTTTVAPTGTISIIAGCSSGIEPVFALSFVRNIMEGTRMVEVNPIFERVAKECGFYSQCLMGRIARLGSIQEIQEIPAHIRRVFVTALDVSPDWHLKIQAAFQKYTDNSVSKTINLPAEATVEEVKKIYLDAYRLGCKGITIYRYGSKPEQVLSLPGQYKGNQGEESWYTAADAEYSGGCPTPGCTL